MNQNFPKNSFFNLPSCDKLPEFALSLQLIDTFNAFSPAENQNLQTPPQLVLARSHEEEDSIAVHLSLTQAVSNSTKKKKVGCNCKKTLCLKMYCECFSTGKVCGEDCACTSCKNTTLFKGQIALAKITVKEGGLRNCSLAEKRCNCKKSHCQKRYCECYNSGVGCTPSCKCEDCSNRPPTEQRVQILTMREFELQGLYQNEEGKQQKQRVEVVLAACHSLEDIERFYS